MATGYEVEFYANVKGIRQALEKIARVLEDLERVYVDQLPPLPPIEVKGHLVKEKP
jgi:hypothetical protein